MPEQTPNIQSALQNFQKVLDGVAIKLQQQDAAVESLHTQGLRAYSLGVLDADYVCVRVEDILERLQSHRGE